MQFNHFFSVITVQMRVIRHLYYAISPKARLYRMTSDDGQPVLFILTRFLIIKQLSYFSNECGSFASIIRLCHGMVLAGVLQVHLVCASVCLEWCRLYFLKVLIFVFYSSTVVKYKKCLSEFLTCSITVMTFSCKRCPKFASL